MTNQTTATTTAADRPTRAIALEQEAYQAQAKGVQWIDCPFAGQGCGWSNHYQQTDPATGRQRAYCLDRQEWYYPAPTLACSECGADDQPLVGNGRVGVICLACEERRQGGPAQHNWQTINLAIGRRTIRCTECGAALSLTGSYDDDLLAGVPACQS